MNHILKIVFVFVLILLQSCKNNEPTTESELLPLPLVTTVNPVLGHINENEQLNGQIVYLNKTTITAPISGYVINVNVKLGDIVKKGARIFNIQTKESKALENNNIATSNQFGIIPIYATASGYINTLEITDSGVYVSEGNPLTTIVKNSDLAIQVNAPFQYSKVLNNFKNIEIELPNQDIILASFYKAMPVVDPISQTQQILFTLNTYELLPENLNVIVKIHMNHKNDIIIIPKDAVLTNETQDEFWVMMVKNSMAIKIPVEKGIENENQVEIVNPKLELTDNIIEKGAFGLPDSSKVKIN